MNLSQKCTASLSYGGLCLIAALAAFPCFRFLPTRIERLRFYHGNEALLLSGDLALAKNLAELCFYLPFLLALLSVVALFHPGVAQTRMVVLCAFGLAALYSVFIVVLSASLDTAIVIQQVR